ncbi:unnamed protein product [Peronospora belbahrii]|uniref:Uncharacterized protein n=1 Tax=Peronospora belbahrii TaxID=622444 RepID=A0AAU9KJL4_9STRA|nr:unnamed protein product [Peronospora belbahrii]CAH0520077.1 unnamed protein product [Peronospora belbahrii]
MRPGEARVAMADCLKTCLESKVIAVIPPYVRMPKHIGEKTLLLQLLQAHAGGTTADPLARGLVKSAKHTSYDAATHRLASVLQIEQRLRVGTPK